MVESKAEPLAAWIQPCLQPTSLPITGDRCLDPATVPHALRVLYIPSSLQYSQWSRGSLTSRASPQPLGDDGPDGEWHCGGRELRSLG